ncbi:MAG: hypothetical protein L0Z51_12775 [Candidatus Latescibacteria bacterium]|nr:hypothetical protein [Candidatus Latescibacterota bacterium]
MPIEYVIEVHLRRVVATVHGTLTEHDVFGYQRNVWTHPEIAGFDEIVDMTYVEHVDLPTPSGERMRALAELSAEMDAVTSSRFAIVAPGDFAYGLARMYGTYRALDERSTKEVRVFRSMQDAMAWLEEERNAE